MLSQLGIRPVVDFGQFFFAPQLERFRTRLVRSLDQEPTGAEAFLLLIRLSNCQLLRLYQTEYERLAYCEHTHALTRSRTHTHMAFTGSHACPCAHTHTHTHAHTRTHTHTHIHTHAHWLQNWH